MRDYKALGFFTIRASGSHGEFDVVCYHHDKKPNFIQCKVVSKESEAYRITNEFLLDERPSKFYHQTLRIKIKGNSKPIEVTI